ncbi:MAG: DUF2760 domain-containing protein [Bacteroidetes bacterium]|jgi:hypothetical protein|nr:DUF2760 domain-containing protein [Bacteroidota bacterium]
MSKQSLTALAVILVFIAGLLAVLTLLAAEALAAQLPLLAGLGAVVALALWFTLERLRPAPPSAPAPEEAAEEAATPSTPEKPSPIPAVQLLSLLQRKGRLIDFLQEDIQAYDDAQIGAAVRNVHSGCREVLDAHVSLAPVMETDENTSVTIDPGFDAHAIRLTGTVSGEPPFTGMLRHRGWRVEHIDLPQQMQEREALIVAPAEVEVN